MHFLSQHYKACVVLKTRISDACHRHLIFIKVHVKMKPGRFDSRGLFFLFSKPENVVDEYIIIRATVHLHLSNTIGIVHPMSPSFLQRERNSILCFPPKSLKRSFVIDPFISSITKGRVQIQTNYFQFLYLQFY